MTSFEEAVKELKLQPDQYVHSTRLREWARRNKNSKFIPESLLQAWGFETGQLGEAREGRQGKDETKH